MHHCLGQDPDTPMDEMMDWLDDALASMIRANLDDREAREEEYRREMLEVNEAQFSEPQDSGEPPPLAVPAPLVEDEAGPRHTYPHEYIYSNLKAIFIEPWDGMAADELGSASKLWLQKSISAGIENGVDVRIRTNVSPPRHNNLQFHVAPDRFDMRPNEAVPANERFDPIKGRWVRGGCGNCGNCDACFALFPRELWAQAYRLPASSFLDNPREENWGEYDSDQPDDYDPRPEIWTRFERMSKTPTYGPGGGRVSEAEFRDENWMRENDDGTINYYLENLYGAQKVEEYSRNRRCPAIEIFGNPEFSSFPPIGFPETARQQNRT